MGQHLTLEALQTTPEFRVLNPNQKRFLLEVLKDGDGPRAAKLVYPAHSNPAIAAATLLSRDRVQSALRVYFGIDPADQIREDLHKLIRQHLRRNGKSKGKISPELVQMLQKYEKFGGSLKSLPLGKVVDDITKEITYAR